MDILSPVLQKKNNSTATWHGEDYKVRQRIKRFQLLKKIEYKTLYWLSNMAQIEMGTLNRVKEILQDVNSKNMKKQLLILSSVMMLACLSSCSLNRNGSYTQTIKKNFGDKVIVTGTVYDTNINYRTLPGAAIKSADTSLLTTTDSNGKYRIQLMPGKHILRATYLGYHLTSTNSLNLVKGDSVIVDFILKDAKQHTTN
ncbi:carboxypeptidase regulatory-like domain-containing protein [Pedobacter punctiformis]|uniref:Carboxypeptidase-like regulatory domain-containing protein n=1 Tax=Pedobacter punctiformis TaxID=3004097 RepID=A0ABT4L620_9SPHI|nr:carboxypeptidase regulatory-like domain-containing protein [Pedobacter sp. HCMS5-2]MCZ4243369.1 carboxypeptidase-like regulatory domain-containing protein [Pedobacter sp. HCMS5-2]